MRIRLIQVPYMTGDECQGGSKGPERLVQAGAEELVGAKGIPVTVQRVSRDGPFRDSASASLTVNRQLAAVVGHAMAVGELPLILAGSCDVSMGVLAGFDHGQCGVVWMDAHGDFNTPESTTSGFFAGMSLAVIIGDCYSAYWTQMGKADPVAEAATLLLGLRDRDSGERERLDRSAIQVVPWHDGRAQGDLLAALDVLARRVREVYLHIDMDALDPDVAPGIVDKPVRGGLSLEDLQATIEAITARFRLRAAALTTYNPELDRDEKTLRVGLRIVELLAECAAQP